MKDKKTEGPKQGSVRELGQDGVRKCIEAVAEAAAKPRPKPEKGKKN